MEHSLLHGLQLCGLIFALGGALFRVLVLFPTVRECSAPSGWILEENTNLWIARAASAAALGTILDIFVQVAELEGRTIYTGVSLSLVARYLTSTTVGALILAKAGALLLAALATRIKPRSMFLPGLLILAAIESTLVSHAAALPQSRAWAVVGQFLHIAGAAFWLGMLAFVLLATNQLKALGAEEAKLLSNIVARFSRYALASVLVISLSGLYSASRFIVSPRAILASAYGLTLLLKLLLLAFVLAAGFMNWRVIRPQLAAMAGLPGAHRFVNSFTRLLELELSAGLLLILVAGILGAISPPSEPDNAQLTSRQAAFLLSPRMPAAQWVQPADFVGAAIRTEGDFRYAEFTHQWSGVFVIVLGLCWLGQSTFGRRGEVFRRSWPFFLLPFGCFISAIADPEVWILRTYSVAEVLSNPQVLEHQMGAALVFALAALGWREKRRDPQLRPLGYALPFLMIAGSLMLLGHAHSSLSVPEDVGNLINLEHAIIGSLGLIAGAARWFQLRQLPGSKPFRFLWPASIVLLGIFMAFFYRELVPNAPAAALAVEESNACAGSQK